MAYAMASKKQKSLQRPENTWQLQTAKAKFSELFRLVLQKGPQWVTRQGKEAVVVLPATQFDALMRWHKGPESLADFFAQSPLAKFKIALDRDKDVGRDIAL